MLPEELIQRLVVGAEQYITTLECLQEQLVVMEQVPTLIVRQQQELAEEMMVIPATWPTTTCSKLLPTSTLDGTAKSFRATRSEQRKY